MPNFVDELIVAVLGIIAAAMTIATQDRHRSVVGGDDAVYPFMYKSGDPQASAFSVIWRETTPGVVGNPIVQLPTEFSPSSPGSNVNTFSPASMTVETPEIRVSNPEIPLDEANRDFTGDITLHQA